jgi:hypothetical protein
MANVYLDFTFFLDLFFIDKDQVATTVLTNQILKKMRITFFLNLHFTLCMKKIATSLYKSIYSYVKDKCSAS